MNKTGECGDDARAKCYDEETMLAGKRQELLI